jgi:hypothetical protein
MPIIKDYECPKCGWLLQSWHTENKPHIPPLCPSCMIPASRIYNNINFILKGIGWAVDGYTKDIEDAENYWRK